MAIGPRRWRDQRWLVDEAIRKPGHRIRPTAGRIQPGTGGERHDDRRDGCPAKQDQEDRRPSGTSFGSHWITQIAATQPSLLGCAAPLPVFEPGGYTIFEQASPTFKARHLFMAGMSEDEAAFDALVAGYDLRPLVETMQVPWMVVAGEADELSPVEWVYDMVRRCPAPTSLLVYAGARHSLTESGASLTGPP